MDSAKVLAMVQGFQEGFGFGFLESCGCGTCDFMAETPKARQVGSKERTAGWVLCRVGLRNLRSVSKGGFAEGFGREGFHVPCLAVTGFTGACFFSFSSDWVTPTSNDV